MKPPIIWMSTILYIEKSEMDLISFTLLWFQKPCNPIFYMSATMHWDIMVPQDYTISLEVITTGKSYIKSAIVCTFLHRMSTGNPKRAPIYQLAFTNS